MKLKVKWELHVYLLVSGQFPYVSDTRNCMQHIKENGLLNTLRTYDEMEIPLQIAPLKASICEH